ncbi:MAG: MFS transporter [Deltaproteobacteria bacterium]|nr:MFS transporter [Deltaproteobacteria bacterium]
MVSKLAINPKKGKNKGMEETSRKTILGLNRNVFFAGLVSLFMDISSEMVYPLVPLFLTNVLGTTKTTVGIIEGIAEATASVLKVFSGWLSDKLDKRKMLMAVGYGISVVSRPVIANAATWFEVLTARFIDRFGKGIRTAPRDAIIADSTTIDRLGLAFGFHRSMDTIGAAIGPAIAFALLFFFVGNLRLVFYASAIPGLVAVVIIILFIKERKRAREEEVPLPRLSLTSFNGRFRRYMLVIAIFSLGNFADAFLVLRASDLGVRNELIPVIYLTFNIVYAATSTPLGALADRVGVKNMITASFIFYAAVYAGVGFSTAPLHIWLLFPLYGVYKGMTEGTQKAYLASIAPPRQKATAFGVYHTVSGLMLLPSSIIAGRLWDSAGPSATFFYGSVMAMLAAVVFALSGKGRAGA